MKSIALPSWTEFVRLNPVSEITINIGATRAVAVEREEGLSRVVWRRSINLSGAAALEAGELRQLAPLVAGVRDRIGNRFVPVRVGLADPVVRNRIYLLDATESNNAELCTLATWRLQREFESEFRCVAQSLGESGGKHLVLAAAIPLPVAAAIEQLLEANRLVPQAVAPLMLERLNRYGARLRPASGWVVIDTDYWSLCVLDEAHRPRLLRARWHGQDTVDDLVKNVTQTLRVVAQQTPNLSMLHVTAAAGEMTAAAAAFNRMLPGVWESLPIDELTWFTEEEAQ